MFRVEGNKLIIEYDMYDEIEEFSRICHDLLNSDYDEIELYFNDHVQVVGSNHVGAIIMASIMASMKEKGIKISCSRILARNFRMFGGHKLKIEERLRDDSGETIG